MLISLFLIVLSAALGIGVWYLVVHIIFSIGGGDIYSKTDTDALIFFIVIFLVILIIYFYFVKHLLEQNKQLLLTFCFATTFIFFMLTPWLSGIQFKLTDRLSEISTTDYELFLQQVGTAIGQNKKIFEVDINESRREFKELRKQSFIVVLNKSIGGDIQKSDIENLSDVNYGNEVRIIVYGENKTNYLDIVVKKDNSISYCFPYTFCEELGISNKVN